MAGTSVSDVLTAIQSGVVAVNNFGNQLKGSFTNISAKIAANTAAIAALTTLTSSGLVTSIAGNTGAFTLNATSGITNSTNDILLSQASSVQFGAVKVDGTTITAAAGVITAVSTVSIVSPSPITASTSADVALSNTANYFTGPSIAQGSTGTWFVSGSVTLTDTSIGNGAFSCKLWDGTTVIASGRFIQASASNLMSVMALSGIITNPSSDLKISCKDTFSTSGKILFNATGESRDSTITAYRIA